MTPVHPRCRLYESMKRQIEIFSASICDIEKSNIKNTRMSVIKSANVTIHLGEPPECSGLFLLSKRSNLSFMDSALFLVRRLSFTPVFS